MLIYIDDGSTNIKMTWQDGDVWKTHLSPNSFCHGWSPAFGESISYNYEIDGNQYCFNQASPSAIHNNRVDWQYSSLNALAIQHALQSSGIPPQAVEIVITLPLSEYYDASAQINVENIERKKASVQQKVSILRGESFTFTKVRVRPESIPAGIEQCMALPETDTLLIVDLGGTTLDVAMVSGQLHHIYRVYGDVRLGTAIVMAHLTPALKAANTPTSPTYAEKFIRARDDLEFIATHLNNASAAPAVQAAIYAGIRNLTQRVLDVINSFDGYSQIVIVGGGAPLIGDSLRDSLNIDNDRCVVVENPQFALVNGLRTIG